MAHDTRISYEALICVTYVFAQSKTDRNLPVRNLTHLQTSEDMVRLIKVGPFASATKVSPVQVWRPGFKAPSGLQLVKSV